MYLGEKIKTLRKEKKLTQEQLAEYLHISSQAVSKWETGASAPDVDTLPKLAVFFGISLDELFDFDHRRVEEEVQKLIIQSLPLREDPAKAEVFYREALKKYPNNEALLNCLLMTIPDTRAKEKIAIGEQLLDCTKDDAIRYDVLRLLAQTSKSTGEDIMAKHYLEQIPELYFLKTEIEAVISSGAEQRQAINKTEKICLGILCGMAALRITEETDPEKKTELRKKADELLALFGSCPEHKDTTDKLAQAFKEDSLLEYYR